MSSGLTRCALVTAVAVAIALAGGCNDPVTDDAIAALGPEKGTPGPDHRPGQPCVLCHSDGGPASDQPFAVAGTVYKTNKPGSDGASGITVQFIDARGGAPRSAPQTSDSGNFYVPLSNWPDVAFPIRVALYNSDALDKPIAEMQSNIGRQGSCNYCHQPNIDPSTLPSDPTAKQAILNQTAASAGQIYVSTQ